MTDHEPECYLAPDPRTGFLGEYGWTSDASAYVVALTRDVIPAAVFDRLEGGELDECGHIRVYIGRLEALLALRNAMKEGAA